MALTKAISSQQFEEYFEHYDPLDEIDVMVNILKVNMGDESNSHAAISAINRLLSSATTKPRGFSLLHKILPFCSPKLMAEKATIWINMCVSYNHKKEVTSARLNCLRIQIWPIERQSLDIIFLPIVDAKNLYLGNGRLWIHRPSLGKILDVCSAMPDFNRHVTTLIPKILDMCIALGSNNQVALAMLGCVQSCAINYPNACGVYKNKLEGLLIFKYVDWHVPREVVQEAGKTLHYLQQTGGSGVNRINHKNNWTNTVYKLCSTLHSLYDELCEDIEEVGSYENEVEPLEFSNLQAIMAKTKPFQLHVPRRFRAIIDILNGLIVSQYPLEKSASPVRLIDVIKRGLLLDPFVNYEKSLNDLHLACMIHSCQIELFGLLRSTIACFRSSIVQHTSVITKLLVMSLQRAQTSTYLKRDSTFRKAAYNVLDYLVETVGNTVPTDMHQKLSVIILEDVSPEKQNVVLSLNTELAQKKSHKAKKQSIQNKAEHSKPEVIGDNEAKVVICLSALTTLKTLLTNVPLSWPPRIFKALYTLTIEEILKIQAGSASLPYTNPNCELALYEVLECFLELPRHVVPPPIDMAIMLFRNGQACPRHNSQLSHICQRALNSLEKVCQPIGPALVALNSSVYHDEAVEDENKFSYHQPERSASKRLASEWKDEDEPQNKTVKILDVQTIKPANPKPIITDNGTHNKTVEGDGSSIISTTHNEDDTYAIESSDGGGSEELDDSRLEIVDGGILKGSEEMDFEVVEDGGGKVLEVDSQEVGADSEEVKVVENNNTKCIEVVESGDSQKDEYVEGEKETVDSSQKDEPSVEIIESSDDESMLNSFVDVVDE